jgi:hypothetical protein
MKLHRWPKRVKLFLKSGKMPVGDAIRLAISKISLPEYRVAKIIFQIRVQPF